MTLFFPNTRRTSVGLEFPRTSKPGGILEEQPAAGMEHRQGLRHRGHRNRAGLPNIIAVTGARVQV